MEQEIKVIHTKIDTKISFTNDIFFKYSLSGDDQKSQELRLGIIRSLIPKKFKEVKVINPEITADVLQG